MGSITWRQSRALQPVVGAENMLNTVAREIMKKIAVLEGRCGEYGIAFRTIVSQNTALPARVT